jgi:translation initiation factor 1
VLWIVDPFAEANAEDSGAGAKEYVHVRIQQRNGRKSLTTVQGLKKEFSYNKILKDLKKEFCCNGTVVEDPELGQVCALPIPVCVILCLHVGTLVSEIPVLVA